MRVNGRRGGAGLRQSDGAHQRSDRGDVQRAQAPPSPSQSSLGLPHVISGLCCEPCVRPHW